MNKFDDRTIKTNFKQARLLLIDDNQDQWLLMQHVLRDCLPEVGLSWASSAQQALAQIESWPQQEWEIPKLILLDLYLPTSQDGWALLQAIKAMASPIREIPIVMLSASTQSTDIQKAYEWGIASYLVKPVAIKDWPGFFQQLRQYWWETAALPPMRYVF